MIQRQHFIVAALASMAALTSPRASAQTAAPIVIKLSHVVSPETAKGKAALHFKEIAEKNTGGRVRVEVFPNSVLYKDKEEIEALQIGAVQLLIPAVAKFAPLGLTDFDAFDLPYLFPNLEGLHAVTQGSIGRRLLDKLETRGIKGLAFWDNSFAIFSAKKPLVAPEDMKGLKMRSYSKIIDAEYRALGAVPQTMAFSEMYTGLQSGVIDGQDTVPVNMSSQKLDEVQAYGVVTYHRHPVYALITNKKFWDALPPDIRKILDDAVVESTRFNNAIAQRENADALDALKARGKIQLHELNAAELAAWKRALLPVYKDTAGRVPQELVKAIQNEVGGKR